MLFESKRSEIDIIYKLLLLTQDGVTKTRLQYGAYLCNNHFKEYLEFLLKNIFIEIMIVDKKTGIGKSTRITKYRITERGELLLENINGLFDCLNTKEQKN